MTALHAYAWFVEEIETAQLFHNTFTFTITGQWEITCVSIILMDLDLKMILNQMPILMNNKKSRAYTHHDKRNIIASGCFRMIANIVLHLSSHKLAGENSLQIAMLRVRFI